MEILSGKTLARSPVASLGCLTVMLGAKRRQLGIRASIEPRYLIRFQEVDWVGIRENNMISSDMANLITLLRGRRPSYDTQ